MPFVKEQKCFFAYKKNRSQAIENLDNLQNAVKKTLDQKKVSFRSLFFEKLKRESENGYKDYEEKSLDKKSK